MTYAWKYAWPAVSQWPMTTMMSMSRRQRQGPREREREREREKRGGHVNANFIIIFESLPIPEKRARQATGRSDVSSAPTLWQTRSNLG